VIDYPYRLASTVLGLYRYPLHLPHPLPEPAPIFRLSKALRKSYIAFTLTVRTLGPLLPEVMSPTFPTSFLQLAGMPRVLTNRSHQQQLQSPATSADPQNAHGVWIQRLHAVSDTDSHRQEKQQTQKPQKSSRGVSIPGWQRGVYTPGAGHDNQTLAVLAKHKEQFPDKKN
jgi:hypothetical protein